MKKAFFFLMMLCTYYLAAMYRFLPLMAFCMMGFLTACLSFLMPRLQRRKLHFSFPQKRKTAYAGSMLSGKIHVENTGQIPACRFELALEAAYLTDGEDVPLEITGDCKRGENDLFFHMRASECGLLRLRAESVRIYEWFSLFSVQKQLEEEMQIAVFPAECVLHIAFDSGERKEFHCLEEQASERPGEKRHEIRQIREYRTGDLMRHIHWNLSARLDELFIREYGQESELTVHLCLEMEGFLEAGTEKLSRFYILLYAMVQGFLQYAAQVSLYWFCAPKRQWETASVSDGAQCREVLLRLYRYRAQTPGFAGCGEAFCNKSAGSMPVSGKEEVFLLNMELAWHFGRELLYQFSAEKLEWEIQNKIFLL